MWYCQTQAKLTIAQSVSVFGRYSANGLSVRGLNPSKSTQMSTLAAHSGWVDKLHNWEKHKGRERMGILDELGSLALFLQGCETHRRIEVRVSLSGFAQSVGELLDVSQQKVSVQFLSIPSDTDCLDAKIGGSFLRPIEIKSPRNDPHRWLGGLPTTRQDRGHQQNRRGAHWAKEKSWVPKKGAQSRLVTPGSKTDKFTNIATRRYLRRSHQKHFVTSDLWDLWRQRGEKKYLICEKSSGTNSLSILWSTHNPLANLCGDIRVFGISWWAKYIFAI